ncbi:helix-turn-helix transcriptional regulator [Acetobacterium carbinolicum]|uniref:helix-turn-helix transcriptional regulator n=1 Tax=Acetobacterium carbinolicum TaxID=52690 RepID=UPI0039C9027E
MKKWLIEYREKMKLSQSDLAGKVNVTREYISMIETGNRNPSVAVAKKIGKALGFKWEIFFKDLSNETLPDECVTINPKVS